mgnify:CR=1 FL=1
MCQLSNPRCFILVNNSISSHYPIFASLSSPLAKKTVEKKKKDPNAPKRALSAFLFFSSDKRQEVIDNNPGIKFVDITREISKLWGEIDANSKKKYEEKAKKDKERYEKEKAEYEAKKDKQ